MKRFGWIVGAFLIVVLLVVLQMAIISNASGYDVKESVVFAKMRIEKNTVITGDMLETREIGREAVHPDSLRSAAEAVSKRAAMDIEAGEMLLVPKVSSDLFDIVKAEDPASRLVALELEADQANAWQMSDEQHVDIIFIPKDGEKRDRAPAADGIIDAAPVSSGVMILKNIRIAGLLDEDTEIIDGKESEKVPKYASLEVTADQSVFIAYAKNSGKLELSCIPQE